MSDNNNSNKELIILAIAAIGIMVGFFAYLIYRQNKDSKIQNISQLEQEQQYTLNSQNLQTYEQLLIQNNRHIEDILSNQQQFIKNQQEQTSYLINLINQKINNTNAQHEISDLRNIPKIKMLKDSKQTDIERQTKFGLL